MSLIQKPPKHLPKETLSIRLEPRVKQMLDAYCSFVECGRQHIVEQALLYTFQQDAEFQRWRQQQPPAVTEGEGTRAS